MEKENEQRRSPSHYTQEEKQSKDISIPPSLSIPQPSLPLSVSDIPSEDLSPNSTTTRALSFESPSSKTQSTTPMVGSEEGRTPVLESRGIPMSSSIEGESSVEGENSEMFIMVNELPISENSSPLSNET